jgi:DNA polymerase-3 subunit beta
VKTIPILDPVAETSVVIPARALNELARILAEVDEPVDIVLAQARNQILFHLEGVDLVSRLIDGQFPNYQQVLPQSHTTRAVLDREELLRAVRPAALIAHESANIVKLQIEANGNAGITVSANAEVGDHVGQVEAAVEGDGTTIAFNARYLADVLTNVDAEQFALELNGPLSPGVFRPIGDDQYVHVVMPVRTTS